MNKVQTEAFLGIVGEEVYTEEGGGKGGGTNIHYSMVT